MRYDKEARGHLDALLRNSLDRLNSYYTRKYAKADTLKDRWQIISGIESIIEKQAGLSAKTIDKKPYSLDDYFQQIDASDSLMKKVKSVINQPDKKQATEMLDKEDNDKMRKRLSMGYSTYLQVKNNMKRGKAKSSSNYAKVIMYMLDKGYKI